MLKKIQLIFFLLFLGIACTKPGIENTEIPPEKLVEILVDVHYAEGALLNAQFGVRDSLRKLYYGQIFEIHNITEDQFERDMSTVKLHPRMLEKIYEKVLNEIIEREKLLETESSGTKQKNQ